MRHYCTLFDRNYLPRGLALHRSLLRHGGEFTLHVLCLDASTQEALSSLALPRVELLAVEALEAWDAGLRAARPGRTAVEFYFTCKPVLLAWLLARHGGGERFTYLDSDLYFFADAARAERALAGHPVALSPHRFAAKSAAMKRFGEFNAGWISIDASAEARRFVAWWRERCLEWCRLVVEETRFGDQKYLDQVPALFPGTALAPPGINAGPWNLDARELGVSPRGVMIAGHPLVAYHFHSVRRMLFDVYDCGLHEYGIALTAQIRDRIYRPYLQEVAQCSRQVAPPPRRDGLARQVALTARALLRHSGVRAAA